MDDFQHLTDEQLQQLSRSGSAGAEEYLIAKYARVIRALSRPYFLTGGDSEDLLQEGMLGLISAIRSYDAEGGASFRTYSELCVKRRLLTAVRNANHGKSISLDNCLSLESPLFDENQTLLTTAVSGVGLRGPEQILIDREETDKLFRLFTDILSHFEADVLNLYLSGMSYREIAEQLHRPEKAIDNAVQRIRRKLSRFRETNGDISKG
ncbi:MAG: sigma-70 family RNA polymerase sigma factor [Oscillospiraceae bacterium]|jgi:RNA polymerase sporulation-specific sigma factor|nr:sigma-70 family RNA polymerase sigma factor [Oscillospiraceae bacterium]